MTALCCSSYGCCDSLSQVLGLFGLFHQYSCQGFLNLLLIILYPRYIPAANYSLKVFAGALDFIAIINKVARFQNEVKSVHRANGSSMLSGGN